MKYNLRSVKQIFDDDNNNKGFICGQLSEYDKLFSILTFLRRRGPLVGHTILYSA